MVKIAGSLGEFFHAWHVAKYIGDVAAAGKQEYALPMFVNASLRDPFNPGPPGGYASGGPTDNVISVYRAAAPAIDVVAPDIYMKESPKVMRVIESYRAGGPLLVPEIGPDEFLLTGQRVRVYFDVSANRKANGFIFASVEEGTYASGKWIRSRVWNGDQTDYGLNLTDEPRWLRVRLATY